MASWKKLTHKVRISAWLLFLALTFLAATGMSGMGEAGPRNIPEPARNFTATIVDRADVLTTVTQFSIDGMTHVIGQRGKGHVAVPFHKIRQVDFSSKPDRLEAYLQMDSGETVVLAVKAASPCYGKSDLGNFQIRLGDVKTLIFKERIPSGDQG
jgi:hypothetical protein